MRSRSVLDRILAARIAGKLRVGMASAASLAGGGGKSSAPSRLDLWVRLPREGEAPAEPHPPVSASPGSRLSRSFALPAGLAQPQN